MLSDLAGAWGQRTSTSVTEHRPWPMPEQSWFMGQTWRDLLFAHWRVDAEELRQFVPPQLPLDILDGSAWIGVTPFEVRGLRLRFTLPAPLISAFPELNVRTYVTVGGKPGIYFLSLDADSRFAVASARRTYRFPYFRARMSIERDGNAIDYRSERTDDAGPPARFEARYTPEGAAFNARPDTLDAALIERYCAYTLDESGAIQRAEIHHRPWELRRASAEITANTMTKPFEIELGADPLLHFAPHQDVAIWPLAPANQGRQTNS